MPDFWRLLWDQDVHTVIILDLNVYQNALTSGGCAFKCERARFSHFLA